MNNAMEKLKKPESKILIKTYFYTVNVAKEENLKRNLEPFYIVMVKLSIGLLGGVFF